MDNHNIRFDEPTNNWFKFGLAWSNFSILYACTRIFPAKCETIFWNGQIFYYLNFCVVHFFLQFAVPCNILRSFTSYHVVRHLILLYTNFKNRSKEVLNYTQIYFKTIIILNFPRRYLHFFLADFFPGPLVQKIPAFVQPCILRIMLTARSGMDVKLHHKSGFLVFISPTFLHSFAFSQCFFRGLHLHCFPPPLGCHVKRI